MIIGADEAAARVVELLTAEGYAVKSSTPERVVSDLARHKPRVLLFELDDQSTGVDELIQRIQATAYGAVVPVIFFGRPPGPNPAEVVVLGGDLFLPTPVVATELVDSVTRLGGKPPQAKPLPPDDPPDSSSTLPHEAKAADPGAGRLPTASMAKATEAEAPPRAAKVPEPLGLDDLEDLSNLDKLSMPWDEPPPSPRPKAVEHHPLEDEPDLLKQAMAADLALDPREMALTITTLVPEMRAVSEPLPDEDLPPAEEVTSAPQTEAAGPPELDLDDEPSAVDAIVQEFLIPGGDGDTVAVRIRRTIDAFEEQIVAHQPEPTSEGPTPPPLPGEPRPSGSLPPTPPQDDIDLDALDVDNAAGAYEDDPERVLRNLEDELGTVPPPPEPPASPVVTPGGTEVSQPGQLPPEPLPQEASPASEPGPMPPAPDDGLEEGIPAPFTPAPKNAYTEARKVPAPEEPSAHGTIADSGGPLASPYDLPPVVSAQGFEYMDPRGEVRDVVDTVPGRRTAVHYHSTGSKRPQVEGRGADENTQPAKGLRSPPEPPPADAGSAPPPAHEPPAPMEEPGPPLPPEVPVRLRTGTLAELDPASLLQAIAFHELDGALEVNAEQGRYELFFAHGVPRLAQSSRSEDRMLEMLRRQGRISAEQLTECEEEVASGRRAGAVLLDRGWIKPAELIPTVRLHLEDLVYAIFALEEGTFRFDEEQPLPEEIVYLDTKPAALLLEGVRRKYTPSRIIRLAGSESIIPVKPPDADEGLLAGAELSGRDWRIIDAMDGRTSITQVAETLNAPPHVVWSLAWGLSCLGLVKLQYRAAAPVVDNRLTDKLPEPPMAPAAEEPPFELDAERVLSRHALVREGDYFACLGADPQASAHELRRAYDQARAQFDPASLNPAVCAEYFVELAEIREVIEEAYSVLRDVELREAYHRHVVSSAAAGDA